MQQKLKQRIVGAVVLVALGVIFLPFIFNLEPPEPIDTLSQIPPAPDIVPVTIDAAEPADNLVPPLAAEEAFMPPQPATTEAAPANSEAAANDPAAKSAADQDSADNEVAAADERPALTGDALQAWVVQVMSLSNQTDANSVRDKLQAAGYKAYVRQATVGGSATYRVFVGPVALKSRAVADQQAINKAFKVQSLVLNFSPDPKR